MIWGAERENVCALHHVLDTIARDILMKNVAAIFACFVLVGGSFAQSSKSNKTRARRNKPTVEKKDPLSYEEFLKETQAAAELPWQFGTSVGVTNDEANYVDLKRMIRTRQGTHKVWVKSFSLKHVESRIIFSFVRCVSGRQVAENG